MCWVEIVSFQTFDAGLGMPVIVWKGSIYQKMPLRRGRIGGGQGHWLECEMVRSTQVLYRPVVFTIIIVPCDPGVRHSRFRPRPSQGMSLGVEDVIV